LKKVHDNWLVSGGYVALLTASGKKSPNSAYRIYENLGHEARSWHEMEADLLKAGFTKHYEHKMHAKKDFTDPSENLLPFFQLNFKDRIITLDELRDAMKGPISEGKIDDFNTMAIFKSTN